MLSPFRLDSLAAFSEETFLPGGRFVSPEDLDSPRAFCRAAAAYARGLAEGNFCRVDHGTRQVGR